MWKPLVEDRPMPVRSVVLALLFLLCAPPAGLAAEPSGGTVVLRLPPSMSPATVKGLIADLAAKGVQPAAPPHDPPEAASPPPLMMTGMKSAAQIWAAAKEAMRALPVLLQAAQVWVQRVEAEAARARRRSGFGPSRSPASLRRR